MDDGPLLPQPQAPRDQTWDGLLSTGPDLSPAEVIEDTRHLLGLGARGVRYGDGLPDVGDLRGKLGRG